MLLIHSSYEQFMDIDLKLDLDSKITQKKQGQSVT